MPASFPYPNLIFVQTLLRISHLPFAPATFHGPFLGPKNATESLILTK
jgi:hypothetical protein